MQIIEIYSHLNGEEYLIVHHPELYAEIRRIIGLIDATGCRTKKSREKTMPGKMILAPKKLNACFKSEFGKEGWGESVYRYCVTTDRALMQQMLGMEFSEQKEFMVSRGIEKPLVSYKQTDFVKDKVAVEVQFGEHAIDAFGILAKHLLFYSGGIINVGVEILPMKAMLRDPAGGRQMSTGIAYFEGEVYNILRHGRSSPPVPLLVIGVAP